MNSFFRYSLCACLLLGFVEVYAQTAGLRVFHEKDQETNDYFIWASNASGKDLHVVVDFTTLVGYRSSAGAPIIKNIRAGRTKLSRLIRDELVSESAFNYKFYHYPGVANPKVKEVAYAIPVMPGKTSQIYILKNISERFDQEGDDLYGVAFKGEIGDTIVTARSGRVINIIDDVAGEGENVLTSKKRNVIEIRHKDGTIAAYSIFQNGSAMIEPGQDVKVGDPLALIGGENYQLGPHFRLIVRYLVFDFDKSVNYRDWYSHKYLVPWFRTLNNGTISLENRQTYESVIDDTLITQEMSKREKKKYLKQKVR